jgi:serine/threonine protein kinase
MKLRTGATLQNGKYLLSQALDSDSVGATYLATQMLLNQGVVIKTLDPSLQVTRSFPQLKTRFIEEVRLLARTQHPSIVRVLDFFHEDNLPFLVMEFVPGQPLASLIATAGALSEAEAVHYIRQAGSAVSAAHQNGLIHRNIQPRSILRRHATNLGILVGFGFAHELASASLPATQINSYVPTWDVDSATAIDRYGLATTLYYLLSGHAPEGQLSLDHQPWSPTTKEAILQGISQTTQAQSIEDWLRLLPNTTLPLVGAAPTPAAAKPTPPPRPVTSRPTASQNGSPKPAELPSFGAANHISTPPPPPPLKIVHPATAGASTARETAEHTAQPLTQRPIAAYSGMSRHMPKFLAITVASAATLGVGFGLALRISAAKAPGTSMFHPAQTFADRDWKGTLSPNGDLPDVPIEKAPGQYDDKSSTPADKTNPKATERGSVDVPTPQVTPLSEPQSLKLQRSATPKFTTPQQTPSSPINAAPISAETPAYSPAESPSAPAAPKAAPEPAASGVEPVAPSAPDVAPVPPTSGTPTGNQRETPPKQLSEQTTER